MYRIFCDVNAGTKESGYVLWFTLSSEDIDKIGEDICEGLSVLLYTAEEVGEENEFEATLKFDEELGYWRGIPK